MVACECGKVFASTLSLEQHKEDRKRNRKANACPVCCRSFFKHHGLTEHQITKDHWSSQDEKANALEDKVCLCGNVYHSAADLEQHMSSRKHEYRLAQRQNTDSTTPALPSVPPAVHVPEPSYTMAEKVEEAMHEALSSLASLQEKVEKSGEDTENIRNTIDLLNDAISQKKDENNYIEGAQSVVRVAKSFGDNYDKFTSGDALEIASGAIALIDTIGGVVGGPYGPLITGVCGLIASILPLFGGKKGPSMSEVVDKVIREALDDFRKEEIYGKVIGSLNEMTLHITLLVGIASQNSGHLSTAEQSFLTTTDFTTVAIDTLGVLQGQIEKYESIKNDEKKSQSISLYAYFYCMVSIQRTVIMNLYCSLLRANDMEAIFAGVKEYLFEVLPKKDLKVFEFMSMLPSSKNWWMLYRCLHTTLTAQQRGILCAYTKQIGCPPMIGKLCYLYNDVQNEYMYLPQNHLSNDSSRRNVFTWRRKTCDNAQYLFRLIGDNNNCQIFGVYFGEYIYAADAIHTTAIEGECFPGDLALLHQWVIGKSLVKPFEISTRVNICMLPTLELTMEIEDLY